MISHGRVRGQLIHDTKQVEECQYMELTGGRRWGIGTARKSVSFIAEYESVVQKILITHQGLAQIWAINPCTTFLAK